MIEYRSIGKTFADGTEAVEDFSLVLPSRTTTVFVGSSGCGKTTLLRMVNRMVEPSARPGADRRRRHREPQQGASCAGASATSCRHAGLLPHRKVIDNVATVLRAQRRRPQGGPRALGSCELLETVGLDSSLGRTATPASSPAASSSGSASPVAWSTDPNILLMDEPFGAVDPIVRDELQHELHPPAARARQDDRVRHPRHRRGVPARRPGRDPQEGRRGRPGRHRRPRSSPTRPTTSCASFVGARQGAPQAARRGAATASDDRRRRRRARPPGSVRWRAPDESTVHRRLRP